MLFVSFSLSSFLMGFPGGSESKESACHEGDSSSIPGPGRFTGEGISYPLQHSWASPVAQLVKNPPAMWETWVQSLGWEDPLEKGTVIHSSILAWKIPWARQELDMTEQLSLPGEGNGNSHPVFFPGKSHGQRSLMDYSPCSCKELNTIEVT